MNITQVMLAKKFGGAERLFVDFCVALAEAGENVQAICQKGSFSEKLLKQHGGIRLAGIKVLGSWDLLAARKIRTLIKDHKSQVVQAHLARGALLAGRACSRLGVPLVVTTHNYIDPKYYRYVSMLVPPTQAQFDYYLNKGVPEERMTLVQHFSPLEGAERARAGTEEEIRLVAAGRLVHKKGFHVLLESFAGLEQTATRKIKLDIAGTGPEEENLRTMIEDLGLQDRARLVGWVEDIPGFLRKGDVFVLPSLDEPFGIVVIEAMACDIAIVSTLSQGPGETLDEKTAWLCEAGDVEGMRQALEQACYSPEQRRLKSRRALETFKQLYSKEAVIPRFIELYASL